MGWNIDLENLTRRRIKWEVFREDYIPSEILYRDKQMKDLENTFLYSVLTNNPSNIAIYGNTGTGKTLTVLSMIDFIYHQQEMGKLKYKYKIFYVREVKNKTAYHMIVELAKKVGAVSEAYISGYSLDTLVSQIMKRVFFSKEYADFDHIIFVFDDLDNILLETKRKNKKEKKDTLVDVPLSFLDGFLRYHLDYPASKKNISIIVVGITNPLHMVGDDNVGFFDSAIHFPPYEIGEITEILKIHLKDAGAEEYANDSILHIIAHEISNKYAHNIRTALKVLKTALQLCINDGRDELDVHNDIMPSFKKISFEMQLENLNTFTFTQLTLLTILLRRYYLLPNQPIYIAEAYHDFNKFYYALGYDTFAYRTFYNYLKNLEAENFILVEKISEGRGKGIRGKITLNNPASIVEALVEIEPEKFKYDDIRTLVSVEESDMPLILFDPFRRRVKVAKRVEEDTNSIKLIYSEWLDI